jgi:hypothetical protein
MMRLEHNPILITGAERSGATLIAKILDLCGVHSGRCNGMFEHTIITEFNHELLKQFPLSFPETENISIPANWKKSIEGVLLTEHLTDKTWMMKSATLTRLWPVWSYAFPDAKWLIVRRRTGDVIQSCMKTGYMKTFKNSVNLQSIGLTYEEEGWLWWVHQYENKFIEMMQAGLNVRVIWPERMVTGNYQQIFETVEWLGLKWNNKIPEIIDPLLNKSR